MPRMSRVRTGRRRISTGAICLLLAAVGLSAEADEQALTNVLPRLQVEASGRFLVSQNGEPFFYLADTAWGLLHKTQHQEAKFYLDNRAKKGFNVVQTSILAAGFWPGLGPNRMGDMPFKEQNPREPSDLSKVVASDMISRSVLRVISRAFATAATIENHGDEMPNTNA